MSIRVIIAAALFVVGCASEESIQAKWDDFVADHSACETASDCAAVYPGCPLGCYAAVSASSVAEAEAEAERLISKYESGGRACDYSCVEAGPLTCEAGKCAFGEVVAETCEDMGQTMDAGAGCP